MLDRAKLARLCEMFRSDNDQERATAAQVATAIVHSAGLTWTSLILGPPTAVQQPQGRPQPPPASSPRPSYRNTRTEVWQGVRAYILVKELQPYASQLNSWEQTVVDALACYGPLLLLTELQWMLLEKIARRVGIWEKAKVRSARSPRGKKNSRLRFKGPIDSK